MSSTTQTIIDGTLDIVRQELAAASAAELDALYAIERAAAIVADSLTRSAAMDQANRQLRRARLAQTQLTATYLQLLAQLEVKVAPIVETVAAPVVAAAPVAYDVRLPSPALPRRRAARAPVAPVVSSAQRSAPAPVAAPVAYDVRLPNPPMPRRRTAR
jgi:hypothetical protein